MYETGLTSASIILNNCQRLYTYLLLSFLDKDLTKKILSISLKIKVKIFDKLLKNNLI